MIYHDKYDTIMYTNKVFYGSAVLVTIIENI